MAENKVITILHFRERKEKIPFIRQNIHESIYDIISNMNKIDPPVEIHKEESRKSVEYILNLGSDEPTEYTDVRIVICKITLLRN